MSSEPEYDDWHSCPKQCWHGWLGTEKILTQAEVFTEGDIYLHFEHCRYLDVRSPVRRCPCDGTGLIEGADRDA